MKLLKACTAIVAALALVVLSALPASATMHNIEITMGYLSTGSLGSFSFGPAQPPGPCDNFNTDLDNLIINETGTGPTTIVTTGAGLTTSATIGTTIYVAVVTKHTGNNNGTITATGSMTWSLSLKVEYHTVGSGPPACTLGTKVCTLQLNGTLTGTSNTPPLTTSETASLTGTSLFTTILGNPCGTPFSTLISTTTPVTLAMTMLHVTT